MNDQFLNESIFITRIFLYEEYYPQGIQSNLFNIKLIDIMLTNRNNFNSFCTIAGKNYAR